MDPAHKELWMGSICAGREGLSTAFLTLVAPNVALPNPLKMFSRGLGDPLRQTFCSWEVAAEGENCQNHLPLFK